MQNYKSEMPETVVDFIIKTAEKESWRTANKEGFGQDQREELRQEMVLAALEAWTDHDETRGTFEARATFVMRMAPSKAFRTILSHGGPNVAKKMRKIIAIHGLDNPEAEAAAVEAGIDLQGFRNLYNNTGAPAQLTLFDVDDYSADKAGFYEDPKGGSNVAKLQPADTTSPGAAPAGFEALAKEVEDMIAQRDDLDQQIWALYLAPVVKPYSFEQIGERTVPQVNKSTVKRRIDKIEEAVGKILYPNEDGGETAA